MKHFVSVIIPIKTVNEQSVQAMMINISSQKLLEGAGLFESGVTNEGDSIIQLSLRRELNIIESDRFAEELANKLFDAGYENFDIYTSFDEDATEETYDGNDFYEAYGELWFNEDDEIDEAEYQGRKVKLGKPMRGDVKKFKVYVKNPKGNVVKVNFGDPNMKIKKSNPARRRSFRARHNCDNPGPRTSARYWSCRAW
jgi:hypothetical protein